MIRINAFTRSCYFHLQLFRRSRAKQISKDDEDDIETFITKSVATIEEEVDEKEGKKKSKG